jgi:hypothetical protein
MYRRRIPLHIIFLLCFLCTVDAFAQPDQYKKHKTDNIVRMNITNPVIFGGRSFIVGYERVLGDHQSISVNIGRTSLPKISVPGFNALGSAIQMTKEHEDKGINVSADYRFYLKSENRHKAPRGVYLAPYISYNSFIRYNKYTLNTTDFYGDVFTKFELYTASVGGELGYQFLFWNRLALDFILIGPGLTNYKIDTSLSTDLSPDDESALFQRIDEILADKVPGFNFIFGNHSFEKSGKVNTTTLGFRYMVHVGFCF